MSDHGPRKQTPKKLERKLTFSHADIRAENITTVGRLHASSPRIFPAPSTGSVPDEVGRQNKKKGEGAKMERDERKHAECI